ncbi:MAG: hypothetical protein ACLP2X_09510 [Syntrophobacteraceae bacterium]
MKQEAGSKKQEAGSRKQEAGITVPCSPHLASPENGFRLPTAESQSIILNLSICLN